MYLYLRRDYSLSRFVLHKIMQKYQKFVEALHSGQTCTM
jgi:hypothetical protein